MNFKQAINKCVSKGILISNDNMKLEYLEYEKGEKRLLWWDARNIFHSHWSYPEDKDSAEFIKELNMEWYECNDKGKRLNTRKARRLN